MSKQLLIYERANTISSEVHRDWCVQAGTTYAFAREINSVPLLAAEFAASAGEYAIIFAGNDETVFPSVVLGLQDNQNLFLNGGGTWSGTYIPAFLRRYPFIFSENPAGGFTLCIDEEFEGLNREGRGERLFDSEGKRTQYLSNILNFVSTYQAQFERTRLFCRRLVELKVLDPAQARFQMPDGRTSALTGFYAINRERLKTIPEATLKEMFQTDELELCYLHMHSLANITALGKRAEAAAAPKP